MTAFVDSVFGEFIHWSPDAAHRRGTAMISDPDRLRASAWDQALLNRGRMMAVGTTNASNVVTGAFVASDLGATVDGTGIPSGSRVLAVTPGVNATISANATATGSPSIAVGAPPRSVPGLTVIRSGDEATITWGHPPARVVEFILETCVDGVGTVWTPQTLSADTTHKHVMTVTAGTPLWARITAVCLTGSSYTTVEVRA